VPPFTPRLRLTLLGTGPMTPRYPPTGLLIRYRRQVMLDGAAAPRRRGAEPAELLAAWPVYDERSELRRQLHAPGTARGLHRAGAAVPIAGLVIEP
jgi:hypothetical protein